MDIFCFFFWWYSTEVVGSAFCWKHLCHIVNELEACEKEDINNFDDLYSVIRKKYLSWRAQ